MRRQRIDATTHCEHQLSVDLGGAEIVLLAVGIRMEGPFDIVRPALMMVRAVGMLA
jgi:hypothetical protein